MLVVTAKWIVVLFGVFIVVAGGVMLFAPKKASATLRKAGSTNFINYAEISLRLIPATALILYASHSKFPMALNLLGWFMGITSGILFMVPRKIHHAFSLKSADLIKPIYFQWISPLAFLFGTWIVYTAI